MKLKTKKELYTFKSDSKGMRVSYDGKEEPVLEIRMLDRKMAMILGKNLEKSRELVTTPITFLDFQVNFVTKSGKVYRARSCENHIFLFCGDDFEGEIESISGFSIGAPLRFTIKESKRQVIKFHI